jgi:diguanylate cyclase (GGDEF)-like protein
MQAETTRSRAWLNLGFAAVIAAAAGVASISGNDPDVRALRYGMILMTAAAAFWMPLPSVNFAVPLIWMVPNYLLFRFDNGSFQITEALLELPGLLIVAAGVFLVREQQGALEEEADALADFIGHKSEIDEETGVYEERLLEESIERELVRSRRFGREFALMLADIDELRAKFDYREDSMWNAAFKATAGVLLNTRTHIDRVYRFGEHGFALLLPETGANDISGLIRRLARAAKSANPPEGQPGGPLPLHFGVTFFPICATAVDDLVRRAEVALRIAEKNPNRVQIDGAEAPELPAPELLRREDQHDETPMEALAGGWLGTESPEEEKVHPKAHPTPMSDGESEGAKLARGPAWPTAGAVGRERVCASDEIGTTVDRKYDSGMGQRLKGEGTTGHAESGAQPRILEPALAGDLSEMLARMKETLARFREAKAMGRL